MFMGGMHSGWYRRRGGVTLGLVLGLLGLCPTGAPAADAVLIWPKFQAGDRFTLEFTRTHEQTGSGARHAKAKTTTPIAVEVLECGPDGFVVSWTIGKTKVLGNADLGPLAVLADAAAGLRLEVEVDAAGIMKGVRNYAELEPKFRALIDLLYEQMSNQGLSEEQRDELRAALNDTFGTREAVEQSLLREAALYLVPAGWAIDPREKRRGTDTIPNPFGGTPIPAEVRLWLLNYTPDAPRTRIKLERRWDREKTTDALLENIARRFGENGPPRKLNFDAREEASFVIDAEYGWLAEAQLKRRTRVGTTNLTETTELRVTDAHVTPHATPPADTPTTQPATDSE